ncbi:hypothetical protein C5167_044029 [Papaver somniferum]|uniref:Phytocyanin domain-containing protein n=1 Tax=Papaver somniferum TaxID=3469 RepID=A0A4Y7L8C0_PAPSO|nr:basic blue protein-like [Papaver somniferum]RZC81456.1 hypothetical protein C5167_044029 [Papaver somniferum]
MKASVASNLAVISFYLLIIGFSSISVYVNASRNHIVGGDRGWRFPSKSSYNIWALHRSFAAGDTLHFKYSRGAHNIVRVDAAGYRKCKVSATESAKAVSSGSDKILLKKGINYFICSLPGHCAAGMKMKVHVKKKKAH